MLAALLVASAACRAGAVTDQASAPGEASRATRTPSATRAAKDPGAQAGADLPYLKRRKLYSQNDEELIIRDFFQDRRDGFFLDVGCAWPMRNSTTYYLERHLGWSGIGVDALAEYGPRWAKARPRSKFFARLVGDRVDESASFYRADWTGVSSTRPERTIMGRKIEGKEIKVPIITLDRLLDDNGVKRVHFLSMDIEGSEPEALAGFDIERFRPELVCIEATPSIRKQIRAYFAEHGYERIEKYRQHDRINWYFRPRQQP